jgi:putative ABC transport system permease protein
MMAAAMRRLLARVWAFLGRGALDADFDQELESHIAMLADENLRSGMTPEHARRAAAIRVGGRQSIKQQHRDARGFPFLADFLQDLRFALRLIAKERWFSAVAIVTLALGIGVNAIGFTIVEVAFFRGLAVEHANELYAVSWETPSGSGANVSYAELQAWRDQSRAFHGLAAYTDESMNISDDRGLPEQVEGTSVTANLFGQLGQHPLLGRDFAPGDDARGAERVVIIGHSLWNNRFGSDPAVLGATLRVNGEPATIIGVMPQGMRFPDSTELWAPFHPTEAELRRDTRLFSVVGRLRAGSSPTEAEAALNSVARQLAAEYPDTNKDLLAVSVLPLREQMFGGFARTMFLTVMAAVGFVLLIACANVANLLLARSVYRAREIAVRIAIGATRWRVVRQLLVESLVLALAGGGLGLVIATFGTEWFERAMQDSEKPYWMVFSVNRVVFAYVAATCIVTAILFGLAPALHVSKTNNHDVLKDGGRGNTGNRRVRWLTSTMVVAELALTIVLLAGAGLMIRSFINLYSVDLGIDIDRLTTMRMRLPETKYVDAESRRAFFARLEPRLRAIPGIEASAVSTGVPPHDGGERLLEVDRTAGSPNESPRFVSTVAISPQFFDVVDRPLVRGRGFEEADGTAGSETVIINERLAAQFFTGEDPIGRRLRFTRHDLPPGTPPEVWRIIVGVSAPIRHGSPQDRYLNAVVYVPYRQDAPASTSLVIRSSLPPASVMDAVRREVQAIDPDQPLFTIQTVEQTMAADRWAYRIFGTLFTILAAIGLVISSVGLYAVMSYSVTQRTQEIGVRMAVGAGRLQVMWLILKRGLMQLAIGLPLGLAGAFALNIVLERIIVDMAPGDPLTFAAITIVLAIVAVAACLVPARRATRVDPIVALRGH